MPWCTYPIPECTETFEQLSTLPARNRRRAATSSTGRHRHLANLPRASDVVESRYVRPCRLELLLELRDVILRDRVVWRREVKYENETKFVEWCEGAVWAWGAKDFEYRRDGLVFIYVSSTLRSL